MGAGTQKVEERVSGRAFTLNCGTDVDALSAMGWLSPSHSYNASVSCSKIRVAQDRIVYEKRFYFVRRVQKIRPGLAFISMLGFLVYHLFGASSISAISSISFTSAE